MLTATSGDGSVSVSADAKTGLLTSVTAGRGGGGGVAIALLCDESVKGCCSGSGRGQRCGLGFLGPVWSTTRSYSGGDPEHQ